MRSKHKRFISENIGKKSVKEIASRLGIKEKEVEEYLKEKDLVGNKKIPGASDIFSKIFRVAILLSIAFIPSLFKDQLTNWHDNVEILNSIGVRYLKSGDLKNAKEMFDRAVGLDPEYANSYSNLGGILYRMGDFDGAIKYLEKSIEVDPYFLPAYENLKSLQEAIGVRAVEKR
ncbi:MAG TPA: tetratricopeptide repeat protein [Candidatus Omnitrophota bacterium]|nr:tetratricopeptide repeat protein [Candidatus Omnitrophota bacterium]